MLGTLAIAAVWWLGCVLFDRRVALIAAAMAAVYPGAIAMSVLALSEAAFCPLMLAGLAMWARAGKAPRPGPAAAWALGAWRGGGSGHVDPPELAAVCPIRGPVADRLDGVSAGCLRGESSVKPTGCNPWA